MEILNYFCNWLFRLLVVVNMWNIITMGVVLFSIFVSDLEVNMIKGVILVLEDFDRLKVFREVNIFVYLKSEI